MMAVDDVRRAQILLVDAMERLEEPAERHRAGGDFLYAARLLFSHLHEAGHALRQLDAAARGDDGENRINGLLAGEDHREGMVALKACRRFFSAQGYWASLIPRVRNAIGSHYDERVVAELVKDEFTGDQLLEDPALAAEGLADQRGGHRHVLGHQLSFYLAIAAGRGGGRMAGVSRARRGHVEG